MNVTSWDWEGQQEWHKGFAVGRLGGTLKRCPWVGFDARGTRMRSRWRAGFVEGRRQQLRLVRLQTFRAAAALADFFPEEASHG